MRNKEYQLTVIFLRIKRRASLKPALKNIVVVSDFPVVKNQLSRTHDIRSDRGIELGLTRSSKIPARRSIYMHKEIISWENNNVYNVRTTYVQYVQFPAPSMMPRF